MSEGPAPIPPQSAMAPSVRRPKCVHDEDPRRWREAPLAQRVFILHNQIMRVSDRLVAPLGLTSSRWLLLGALEKYQSPPTLSELSQDGLLTLQNVSRMVAAMEAEGLVERYSQPGRGRSVFVRILPAGFEMLDAAEQAARRFSSGFLKGMDERSVQEGERMLESLIGNLELFERELNEESQ